MFLDLIDMKKKTRATLIIDSREKTPWDFFGDEDFESVITEKVDAGDYTIKDPVNLITIERKGSIDEIYNNFSTTEQKERMYREAERLKSFKYRFIIVEQTLDSILNPDMYFVNKNKLNKFSPYMPPAVVINNFIKFMLEYGVFVIFAGNKGKQFCKKLLLQAYNDRDS